MIGWLALLPLRTKLIGFTIAGVLLVLAGLWVRMRLAQAGKAKAEARAAALEAVRRTEQRIATKRSELRERQRLVREQIEASKVRDGLDGQGWGP
jgi:hypothetical protein